MIMGLRLCRGVSFGEFVELFHRTLVTVYRAQTKESACQGLLRATGRSVSLCARGRLLRNDVFERSLRVLMS